jgi:hypothetical protein
MTWFCHVREMQLPATARKHKTSASLTPEISWHVVTIQSGRLEDQRRATAPTIYRLGATPFSPNVIGFFRRSAFP